MKPMDTQLLEMQAGSLLGQDLIGRLGFVGNQGIQVAPVHYRCMGGFLYGQFLEPGISARLKTGIQVCFEVDIPVGTQGCRSLILQGIYEELNEAFPGNWAVRVLRNLGSKFRGGEGPQPLRKPGSNFPDPHSAFKALVRFRIRPSVFPLEYPFSLS